LGIQLIAVISSSKNGSWRILRTRQVSAWGESRRGRRPRGEREAAVINSIEVIIAIAVYTPPLIALQHIWSWCCSTFCFLIVDIARDTHLLKLISASLQTATDTGHHKKVWVHRPIASCDASSACLQRAKINNPRSRWI
jgi:hypothetical protein